MFVREGAVIPMKTMASVARSSPDPLVWGVYVVAPISGGQGVDQGGDDAVDSSRRTWFASTSSVVYEDDGESLEYLGSAGAQINCTVQWAASAEGGEPHAQPEAGQGGNLTATISPVTGGYPGMHTERSHVLQFRALTARPKIQMVRCGSPGGQSKQCSQVVANSSSSVALAQTDAGSGCSVALLPAPGTLADPAGTLEIRTGVVVATDGVACTLMF